MFRVLLLFLNSVKLPLSFSLAIVFSMYGGKPHEIGSQNGISLSYEPLARQVT